MARYLQPTAAALAAVLITIATFASAASIPSRAPAVTAAPLLA